MPVNLPLSVWPTAQQTPRAQRAGRYLPVSQNHPARMLPAIARTAIEAYTQPGDLVVDPMCGIGTTLVEALHLGRDAIGVEYEPHWADIAKANTDHAHIQGATGHAEISVGDARHLTHAIDESVHGLVALVLTSPPYGPSTHGHVRTSPTRAITKTHDRYSRDPANLAHRSLDQLLDAMHQVLTGCTRILRPGGIVAMTVRPWWHQGELIDLPGELGRVGERAGLVLYERNVALLAGLRDDHVVPRPSFFALNQVRRARAAGTPRSVIAHEDLLVFRAPSSAGLAVATRGFGLDLSGIHGGMVQTLFTGEEHRHDQCASPNNATESPRHATRRAVHPPSLSSVQTVSRDLPA